MLNHFIVFIKLFYLLFLRQLFSIFLAILRANLIENANGSEFPIDAVSAILYFNLKIPMQSILKINRLI